MKENKVIALKIFSASELRTNIRMSKIKSIRNGTFLFEMKRNRGKKHIWVQLDVRYRIRRRKKMVEVFMLICFCYFGKHMLGKALLLLVFLCTTGKGKRFCSVLEMHFNVPFICTFPVCLMSYRLWNYRNPVQMLKWKRNGHT